MSIINRIEEIKHKISIAANESGRSESDITMVAVTKRVSVETIKEAMDCGVVSFGENYFQEFRNKAEKLQNVKWHFIGQLQTNKVKYIVREISMLHSLDRLSLAKEFDKRLKLENRKLKTLVQINIGREPQKGGILLEDTEKFLSEMSEFDSLDVCGLMCMPPFTNSKDETIHDFAKTKAKFDEMLSAGFNMKYLSMGMSNDFEDAIKQGANIVRIGSAIFGERT